MKQSTSNVVFNHHPHVGKLCLKLPFHNFMQEFKLFSGKSCEFILPTFALNKVEDAVCFLNLEDDDSNWVEKSSTEFTQKHK